MYWSTGVLDFVIFPLLRYSISPRFLATLNLVVDPAGRGTSEPVNGYQNIMCCKIGYAHWMLIFLAIFTQREQGKFAHNLHTPVVT